MSDSDFIERFLAATEGAVSPRTFRLWSAIALIGGALGRRVAVKTGKGPIYPNLYTLLVGPPGAGKSIIDNVKELWAKTLEPGTKSPAFRVASNSLTSASLVDELAKAKSIRIGGSGPPIEHHSLLVAAEELQVLLPGYDTGIIGKLNELYNNSAMPYSESRRTGTVREIVIENPNLNIIAGVQPAYFASTFPEEVWSTGFARRVVMIYSDQVMLNSLWGDGAQGIEAAKPWFLQTLGKMSALQGICKWEPDAAARLDTWHMDGGHPAPSHSKLQQYLRNRTVNAIKLAMISGISSSGQMIIRLSDVERALAWLLDAEARMPDIFRAMIGKSDRDVIEEMHYYVTMLWQRSKQKPVNSSQIMRFLLQRVPSEKAGRILQASLEANIIARVAGSEDLFVPRPKIDHQEE